MSERRNTADVPAGAAQHRALLDARSATLARRGIATARQAATRPLLLCACGPDRYGLPLSAIVQVVPARPCTPVPGAPPELLGVAALGGRVVSVLALARVLGRTVAAPAESGHFVVLRGGGAPVALGVDRALGVVDAPLADPPEGFAGGGLGSGLGNGLGAGAISGYAPPGDAGAARGEAGFLVIDLPRLLRRYLPQG